MLLAATGFIKLGNNVMSLAATITNNVMPLAATALLAVAVAAVTKRATKRVRLRRCRRRVRLAHGMCLHCLMSTRFLVNKGYNLLQLHRLSLRSLFFSLILETRLE